MHKLHDTWLPPATLFYCWLVLHASLQSPHQLVVGSMFCHIHGTPLLVTMVWFYNLTAMLSSRPRSSRVERSLFPNLRHLHWSISGPSLVVILPEAIVFPTATTKSHVLFAVCLDLQESSTSIPQQEQSHSTMLCSSVTHINRLSRSRMLGWYVGPQTPRLK
jgi:hypothetical protein